MEEIHYLLGNDCNLDCDFCFWDQRLEDKPLEFKKKVIDQIALTGIKKVTISGGEPLTAGNFIEALEYMHSKGLEIILHSNGLKINPGLAKKIALLVSRVSLALDGSSEEMVLRMRKNKGILARTVFLIHVFHQLNIPVNVKTLVTKVNRDDILNIGALLNRLPISYWSLLEFTPVNKGRENKDLFYISRKEFDEITEKARKAFPQMNIKSRAYGEASNQYCFIAADGKVYTYIQGKGDILVGDLEKEELTQVISRIEKQ